MEFVDYLVECETDELMEIIEEFSDEEIDQFVLHLDDNLEEALSFVERKRRSNAMKRIQKRLQKSKERQKFRPASSEDIEQRARRWVINALKKKFAGGKEELSRSDKERVETRLNGMKGIITRLARKQFNRIKQQDREDMQAARAAKHKGAIDGAV